MKRTNRNLPDKDGLFRNAEKWVWEASPKVPDYNELSIWPKITVVTPSFNQGQFLETTIRSVLLQGYPNLEYIIIDGGSKDDSVSIIKKYDEDIHYWISEKDDGQSDGINKGLRMGTGEIICWLNSDDVYLPGVLKEVALLFHTKPEIDLIYGRILNLYDDGHRTIYDTAKFEPVDFLSRVSVHQPGMFWKRKIHKEVGYLDESFHYLMDYDLWLRIFFTYNTLWTDSVYTIFRRHSDSKTRSMPVKMFSDYRRAFTKFIKSSAQLEGMTKRLARLGILEEEEGSYKIDFTFTKTHIRKIELAYIYNCAVEEYTKGNILKADKLFLASLNKKNFKTVGNFLIKNHLLVPYWKRLIGK